MLEEFSSYFDSYENRSPLWTERVREKGNDTPGLDPEDEEFYERVTPENHPKIYEALKEECEFRGVEIPACYVDSSGETKLGLAAKEYYTLIIDKRSEDMFTPKEMRALMAHELKHLYQGKTETRRQSLQAEYDSDRAAVGSTDYETIRSYVDKSIHMMIDEKVPLPVLRKFMHGIHDTFPGMIAENFVIPTSMWHPSPSNRMKAMREAANNSQGSTRD